ncbi:MAG: hypothetical protein WA421_16980 [Nitrososphaeraceae archaeon]
MSQAYEIRKIHHEGKNRVSRGIVIPLKFLKELNLNHGDYVKIYLAEKEKQQGGKGLWIQKLEE